jgi:hypothetical protein
VNIFEIAIREFVSSLRIRTVPFVDSEMPLCIFAEAVETDELIFFIYGRPMFAPCAFAVGDNMSLVDKSRGERGGIFV